MRLELTRHPDFTCRAVDRIEVELAWPAPGTLALRYMVTGAIADIVLAPVSAPERSDELWRTTCFEAFVAEAGGAYTEFNFAPSTQWAAYHFDGYRVGMQNAWAWPSIKVMKEPRQFELQASLRLPAHASRLALTAVIEEAGGAQSYWALQHPPGRPDFHHSDSFAYELSP
jgi:hypothetical protein